MTKPETISGRLVDAIERTRRQSRKAHQEGRIGKATEYQARAAALGNVLRWIEMGLPLK